MGDYDKGKPDDQGGKEDFDKQQFQEGGDKPQYDDDQGKEDQEGGEKPQG
jgi:hypothetical protein